jgi:hypothetical protein
MEPTGRPAHVQRGVGWGDGTMCVYKVRGRGGRHTPEPGLSPEARWGIRDKQQCQQAAVAASRQLHVAPPDPREGGRTHGVATRNPQVRMHRTHLRHDENRRIRCLHPRLDGCCPGHQGCVEAVGDSSRGKLSAAQKQREHTGEVVIIARRQHPKSCRSWDPVSARGKRNEPRLLAWLS